jgi:hypothetical protein
MTTGAKITGCFIIAFIAIGIGYDIFAAVHWGVDATISRVLLNAATGWPSVAFAFGFLMGHLFGSQHITKAAKRFVWKQ